MTDKIKMALTTRRWLGYESGDVPLDGDTAAIAAAMSERCMGEALREMFPLPDAVASDHNAKRLVAAMVVGFDLWNGYHPDTPAADYVVLGGGPRLFNQGVARRIDRLHLQAFRLSSERLYQHSLDLWQILALTTFGLGGEPGGAGDR